MEAPIIRRSNIAQRKEIHRSISWSASTVGSVSWHNSRLGWVEPFDGWRLPTDAVFELDIVLNNGCFVTVKGSRGACQHAFELLDHQHAGVQKWVIRQIDLSVNELVTIWSPPFKFVPLPRPWWQRWWSRLLGI